MKILINIALVTCWLLITVECSFAREWRGIVPLHSTRADVERLFGHCSDEREACVFSLDGENVYILFSGGLSDKYGDCARSLPPETVMFVEVIPKTKLKLNSQYFEKKTLQSFNPTAPFARGLKAYETKDGLLINTSGSTILQLDYIADPSDSSLCANFYEEPESFIPTFVIHPPVAVIIECAKEARAGKDLVLTAFSSANAKRGPTWTVDVGRVSSGQHTYKVVLDTTGLAGQTILATAEMGDGFGHTATGSCKVRIVAN